MSQLDQSPCRCGHDRVAHEHLRRGSDCASCGSDGCAAFRSSSSWWSRVTHRRPVVVEAVEQIPLATVFQFPQRDVPTRRSA